MECLRIDLQNIYGQVIGRREKKLYKFLIKKMIHSNYLQDGLSPRYAVDNIKVLKEKFDVDFISILDENMTSNLKWTKEFCNLYIEEGLDKTIKWGTLGDAPSVAVQPEIVQTNERCWM